MNKIILLALSIIYALVLTGCLFDSSSSSSNAPSLDINDTTAPIFTLSGAVSVDENQTSAITLVVTDSSSVTFSISEGDSDDFNVNATSGVVTFKVAPVFAVKSSYSFLATATDSFGNAASQNVTITILESGSGVVDTTNPVFTSSNSAIVSENQTNAITLVAVDDQAGIIYSISGGDSADFDVNSTSGDVTFKIAPDFETNQNYSFTAIATDASGNGVTQSISITILDEGIQHNGISYESVVSPYTGKVWLDRNLGASRVCLTSGDSLCFGDYYQWGRETDGHESSTSLTTSTQASDINSAGNNFITTDGNNANDWAGAVDSSGVLRAANWAKTDGSSVCPEEYRVPTISELTDETVAITANIFNMNAFNIFLKLPSAGSRYYKDGLNTNQVFYGSIWSNSVNGTVSNYIYFYINVSSGTSARANGHPVRCIKD